MNQITLHIKGISCQGCIKNIQSSIETFPGVSMINANVSTGDIHIAYEEEKTPLALIIDQIEELGFEVIL